MEILKAGLFWVATYSLLVGIGWELAGVKSAVLISMVSVLAILTSFLITWLLQPVIEEGWSNREKVVVRLREVGNFLVHLRGLTRRIDRIILRKVLRNSWALLLFVTLMFGVLGGSRYELAGALVGVFIGDGLTLYILLLGEAHKISPIVQSRK